MKRRYAGMQHSPSRQGKDRAKIVGRAERARSKSYCRSDGEQCFIEAEPPRI